ncbi:MAG: hypothetical protein PHG64_05965 [Paludibacter sp.]|nr:hypothetical protein [Paludibacter sp.]
MEGNPIYWESLSDPPFNTTGFSAVGTGARDNYSFSGINQFSPYWTKTPGQMATVKRKDTVNVKKTPSYTSVYLSIATIQPWGISIDASSVSYGLSVRCVKNQPPTVLTGMISASRATSAGCEGHITNDGGSDILWRSEIFYYYRSWHCNRYRWKYL